MILTFYKVVENMILTFYIVVENRPAPGTGIVSKCGSGSWLGTCLFGSRPKSGFGNGSD